MYTNQYLNIKWNCCMSKYFATSNGVKQGGVLSPILFGIYIDELLSRLRSSGYGCMIGHRYYGAVGYADDVSFIAPSVYSLKRMCDISQQYANEYDIKFNPVKCQFIYYGDRHDICFNFNGVVLNSLNRATHLGHTIGPNVDEHTMLDASNILTRNVNFISHNFGYCTYDVKYELFKSYCTSFYGSPLWNLTGNHINRFYTTWRKSIRKIFDLPYRTHCNMLPVIAQCLHIETQLLCRFAKFVFKAISSQNVYLSMLMNMSIQGSRSPLSDNFNHMLAKSGISRVMFVQCKLNTIHNIVVNVNQPDEQSLNAGAFALN